MPKQKHVQTLRHLHGQDYLDYLYYVDLICTDLTRADLAKINPPVNALRQFVNNHREEYKTWNGEDIKPHCVIWTSFKWILLIEKMRISEARLDIIRPKIITKAMKANGLGLPHDLYLLIDRNTQQVRAAAAALAKQAEECRSPKLPFPNE